LTIITKVKVQFLQQCTEMNVNKIVIKILHVIVVTQTLLGGLTAYFVANFLYYTRDEYYKNWLAADRVIAIIKGWPFMAHSVDYCGRLCKL